MEAQKVDGLRIRKAIEKHGSLEKAIEALRDERSLLEDGNYQLKKENLELEQTKAKRTSEIKHIDNSLEGKRLEFSQLYLNMMTHSRQYELFQGFLAMIGSSPSATGSIKALIASLQELVGSGWNTSKSDEELRTLFVRRVFGDHLKSFQCELCGSRFIVNPGPNKIHIRSSHECPECHWSHKVKPDDSFLKAMVSEEQLGNTYLVEPLIKEFTILRPFKVLIDIPCEVCGKPISELTEDEVKRGATGLGWAHKDCWNTLLGGLKQLEYMGKYFLEMEERSSEQAIENAGK